MTKATDLPTDQLVEVYIQLRDRRAKRKAEYENDDLADKIKQEKIESVLMSRFIDSGLESVRTKAGTAYKQLRTSCGVADWNSYFNEFVVPNQAWDFIEQRANKTAVAAYRQEHNDLPPGINWSEAYVINVRRS